jgi:hypothetical protein
MLWVDLSTQTAPRQELVGTIFEPRAISPAAETQAAKYHSVVSMVLLLSRDAQSHHLRRTPVENAPSSSEELLLGIETGTYFIMVRIWNAKKYLVVCEHLSGPCLCSHFPELDSCSCCRLIHNEPF